MSDYARGNLVNTDRDPQLRLLTRECSALIRLLLGGDLLDDTGTDT